MAEKHEKMVSQVRAKLVRQRYRIRGGSPFPQYRPDVWATKGKTQVCVEVEIESTLLSNHTLHQLELLHRHLKGNKSHRGILAVPKGNRKQAEFMIDSIFGDGRIQVVGLV